MNPLGIETATFRIVAQCLKQLRYILINVVQGKNYYVLFNRNMHYRLYPFSVHVVTFNVITNLCACAILPSVASIVLQYFSTLSHKLHQFRRKVSDRKYVFGFPLQSLCEIYLLLFHGKNCYANASHYYKYTHIDCPLEILRTNYYLKNVNVMQFLQFMYISFVGIKYKNFIIYSKSSTVCHLQSVS